MMHALSLAQAAAHESDLARDLVVILATAGLTALLLNRLRLPTMPGFLIAGAVIGPHAFGFIADPGNVQAVSQLSTMLLMFTIGLQLDLTRVRSGFFSIVGCAALATAVMTGIGWLLAYPFMGRWPSALVVAMGMSIAATAAPLRLLETRRELHAPHGRLAFGITLFQDLLAVAMLATFPAIAHWAGVAPVEAGSQRSFAELVIGSAKAIGGIAVLIVAGRVILPRILLESTRVGGEVLIVVSASVALGAAVFTAYLGFSPELGAFLAGFLLASTPFRYQIAGQLLPMRDLFLAVFFTAIGLALPVTKVAEGWWVVLLGLVALGAVKVVGITASAWVMGSSARVAFLAATTLAAAGEFTLVVLAQASANSLLTPDETGYAIAVVGLSIISAPLLVRLGHAAGPRLDRVPNVPWVRRMALGGSADGAHETPARAPVPSPDSRAGVPTAPPSRAIVAGFGPVGRAVADVLERRGVALTIIELNPKTIQRQAGLGRRMVYGDASNPEVLESAGLGAADAVILTMPDEEATIQACRVVRALRPDIFIAARANVLSKALQAMQLGADHVVVEEMAAAEAMAAQVLAKLQQRASGEDLGPKLYEFPPIGKV